MTKLSTIYQYIGSYLSTKGDKEVASIGTTHNDGDNEYVFHLCDVREGFSNARIRTGEDLLLIPKEREKPAFGKGRAEKLICSLAGRMEKDMDQKCVIYELLAAGFSEEELIRVLGYDAALVQSISCMKRVGLIR